MQRIGNWRRRRRGRVGFYASLSKDGPMTTLRSRKKGKKENAENQGKEVGNIVFEDPDFVQWRDIVGNLESCFALTRTLPSGSSATKDRISLMREIGDCREKGFNERGSKNTKLSRRKQWQKIPRHYDRDFPIPTPLSRLNERESNFISSAISCQTKSCIYRDYYRTLK